MLRLTFLAFRQRDRICQLVGKNSPERLVERDGSGISLPLQLRN
jgi:hypothetical protein